MPRTFVIMPDCDLDQAVNGLMGVTMVQQARCMAQSVAVAVGGLEIS